MDIQLSPSDREKVLRYAAELIVEELKKGGGRDFSEMIVLPMSAVAQLVGLSVSHLGKRIPVTVCAKGKHGVTLSNIRAFVTANTRHPDKQGRAKI